VRLKSFPAGKANSNSHLAIAQLLIKRIRPFRATGNRDTTAMVPVLHTHTDARLGFGDQQDPVLILQHVTRAVSRAFGVLSLPLDAQLFE